MVIVMQFMVKKYFSNSQNDNPNTFKMGVFYKTIQTIAPIMKAFKACFGQFWVIKMGDVLYIYQSIYFKNKAFTMKETINCNRRR